MANFTPGPWQVSLGRVLPDAPVFGFAILAEGKKPALARAATYEHRSLIAPPEYADRFPEMFTEAEVEANANLIGAAPEMFDLLEDAPLPSLQGDYAEFLPRYNAWLARRREVLDKASGLATVATGESK